MSYLFYDYFKGHDFPGQTYESRHVFIVQKEKYQTDTQSCPGHPLSGVIDGSAACLLELRELHLAGTLSGRDNESRWRRSPCGRDPLHPDNLFFSFFLFFLSQSGRLLHTQRDFSLLNGPGKQDFSARQATSAPLFPLCRAPFSLSLSLALVPAQGSG